MSHNLFLSKEPYSVDKTADVILSRDGEDWEEDVSQNLHREHPYIQDKQISITMAHKSPEHGVGVGSIKIDDKIMIPIVIDKFRMAPLDVFWDEGKLFPMTRDAVEAALQDHDLGEPVSPGQGEMTDVSMYSQSQPPFDGKYSYASHFQGVSSPDELKEAIAEAFDSDAGAIFDLTSNPLIRSALAQLPVGHEKRAEIERNLHINITGGTTFSKVATTGAHRIATAAGPVNGVVADYVIGLDGCPSSGQGMFIGLDKAASYCHLTPGQEIAGQEFVPSECEDTADITHGVAGVFFKIGSAGTACTEVVTPKYQQDGGWSVMDGFGRKFVMHKVAEIKIPVCHGNTVMIPDDWHWRPTTNKVHPMPMGKIAAEETVRRFFYENIGDDVDVEKIASALEASYEGCAVGVEVEHVAAPDLAPISVSPVNLFKEATFIQPCDAVAIDFGQGCQVKFAAVEEAAAHDTVDSLLGLNFITPENIQRFLDKMPILEEARDSIAKLLLASRLGLNTDSRPLRTAMFALDSVIRDLQEVRHETEGYD